MNFIVNKSSWHYRLVNYFSLINRRPISFCAYWRKVVGALTLATLLAIFTTVLTVIALGLCWGLISLLLTALGGDSFLSLLSEDWLLLTNLFWGVILIILGVATFIAVPAAAFGDMRFCPDWLPRLIKKEQKSTTPPKAPSLLAMKYRAWKDKICPIVTFQE